MSEAMSAAVPQDRAAIEAEIKKLQTELDDLEHERNYVLKQTGIHISAVRLKAMEDEYKNEAKRLEDRIAGLKATLAAG
ncbi:MAG: hypothetical protein ACYC6V_09640 [Bacillota bacterium]